MNKEQRNNTYGKFETASVNGAARAITAPVRAVQRTANPPSVYTGEIQAQMNKWIVLALAAAATFMTTLDGSIVNIGLPSIAHNFHAGVSGATEWIIIGYLVVIASVLLTFGRIADMIGRRPIFLTGLVVFTLGSALSGLAPSLLLLILARLFQGIGGALIFSVNVAMITSIFSSHERGLALGLNMVVVSLGLSFGQEWGWLSAGTLAALVISLVTLVMGVYVEALVEHPILNLGLVTNRVFAFANISFMLCMMALFAPGFLLPFYFEELRGFSIIQTGLMMTPLPLMLAVVAPLSGTLADRLGSRWLSPAGLAIACFGLFLLSQINTQSTSWDIIWRLAVTGIGQGLFQSPNTRTMMSAAPRSAQGEASGLLATGRVIGQSMSVALTGTVFAALGGAAAGTVLLSSVAHNLPFTSINGLQNTFVSSFHIALLVCAAFAALGIFTALARGKEQTVQKAK